MYLYQSAASPAGDIHLRFASLLENKHAMAIAVVRIDLVGQDHGSVIVHCSTHMLKEATKRNVLVKREEKKDFGIIKP